VPRSGSFLTWSCAGGAWYPRLQMKQVVTSFFVESRRGLNEMTSSVERIVAGAGFREGLATVFLRHTSASLVIQENADPAVQRDLEAFLNRLVPDGDRLFTHTVEGSDDMPAHVKTAITRTSEQIPIRAGALVLGTWQGVFLWEHRSGRHHREVVVHVLGE
jgi:secondary thiamine-phosphate synthase enzyme